MSRFFVAIALAACVLDHAASAQTLPSPFSLGMSKEYQDFMTAMAAAQAKAMRPGDDAMSCPAIEQELTLSMSDPAIQAYAEKASGLAQKQVNAAQGAQATTAQSAAQLFGAFAGGAGMGGMMPGMPGMPGLPGITAANPLAAAQQAQTAQQQAQAMQLLNPTAQLKLLMPILPQMMRGQQLVQLAFVRRCDWAVGAVGGAAPPAFR